MQLQTSLQAVTFLTRLLFGSTGSPVPVHLLSNAFVGTSGLLLLMFWYDGAKALELPATMFAYMSYHERGETDGGNDKPQFSKGKQVKSRLSRSGSYPGSFSSLQDRDRKERIIKKRTKNEAKSTKPDSEWKSKEKTKSKSKPKPEKSTQVNPEAKSPKI
ncbi:hypothetical protein Tco_0265875 [Tanacetum coccineum]